MGKIQFAVAIGVSLTAFCVLAGPSSADLPTSISTDPAAQACSQPKLTDTPDQTIASCTAVIESQTFTGRPLAIAYAQRGFERTIKRSLDEAKRDLDEAIRIDPNLALAYVNRANFWTVSHKPDSALADAEKAVSLDPSRHPTARWPMPRRP